MGLEPPEDKPVRLHGEKPTLDAILDKGFTFKKFSMICNYHIYEHGAEHIVYNATTDTVVTRYVHSEGK